MGYFSNLDIALKESGYKIVTVKSVNRPIEFLYQTTRMQEPKPEKTRIINGKCLVVGTWQTVEWLKNCVEWTQVQGWNFKVKLIKWL